MGNSHSDKKNSPLSQRKKETKNSKNMSMTKQRNVNEENKGNNINNNSNNNDEIKLFLVIETLIRISRFEKKIKDLCLNEDNENNYDRCIIVSKKLIDKYKEIFNFKSFKDKFDNNEIILKFINELLSIEDNKEDSKEVKKNKNIYISEIIEELKNKRNHKLLEDIKKNSLSDSNKEDYLISVKLLNNKRAFFNFEIINYDIFLLLVEQNISANIFYFADYFINFDKILVFIKDFGGCKDNVICEIGKYDNKEECINIEYVLDNKKIDDSTVFKDKLKYIKISEIYKNISEGQNTQNEIEFKEYNFYFDNDKKFIGCFERIIPKKMKLKAFSIK